MSVLEQLETWDPEQSAPLSGGNVLVHNDCVITPEGTPCPHGKDPSHQGRSRACGNGTGRRTASLFDKEFSFAKHEKH